MLLLWGEKIRLLIKKIIIKKITYIISIIGVSCFLLGWSSFLHRLHREDEEESVWKDFGIINDYVEWKIIPPASKAPKNKKDVYFRGLWRANFRNITDKRKRIWISFELLDKDNFTMVSVNKGDHDSDAIYLFPSEDKIIEGSFVINKKIAPVAYKSQLRLVAKDIEEYKLREKDKKSGR